LRKESVRRQRITVFNSVKPLLGSVQ